MGKPIYGSLSCSFLLPNLSYAFLLPPFCILFIFQWFFGFFFTPAHSYFSIRCWFPIQFTVSSTLNWMHQVELRLIWPEQQWDSWAAGMALLGNKLFHSSATSISSISTPCLSLTLEAEKTYTHVPGPSDPEVIFAGNSPRIPVQEYFMKFQCQSF